MEEFIFVDGKKYRRGYTTGSCLAAATKACMYMFFSKKEIHTVEISTPKGINLRLKIENIVISDDFVECSVKKDGGDDIDATDGMDVFSRLNLIDSKNLSSTGEGLSNSAKIKNLSKIDLKHFELTSSKGIGIVTKKGLSVEVGRPAINPTPIKMIENEIKKVVENLDIDMDNLFKSNKDFIGKKFLITAFAPKGEEIAKKTFNENLGIVGGISIIGTSGIVEPMSDEGWKKSLSAELSIKKEEGIEKIVLVPGNIGLEKMRDDFGYSQSSIVKMSNFVGYMLMESKRLGFKDIVLAGHIGKLIKLSAGIMNTHSRVGDAREEIMISNLALEGAPKILLEKIQSCITTDAMVDLVYEYGYERVFENIAKKAAIRSWKYLRESEKLTDIEVILFSMDGRVLGRSKL